MTNNGSGNSKDQQFIKITEHLAVRIGLVFTGEQAVRASMMTVPKAMVHYAPSRTRNGRNLPPTRKIYLSGKFRDGDLLATHFPLQRLDGQMSQLGLVEEKVEFDILRLTGKAVCARNGEGFTWGFGRPHPTKPDFKRNGKFAGPLVDHRPGQRDDWKFRPVYVGVKDGVARYCLKITTRWSNGQVSVLAEKNPTDVPRELAGYARPFPAAVAVSA